MSTFASSRLRQSSSGSNLEALDPTTIAISLIPLLPAHLSREHSDHITLPVLAASLSTLPHNVVNAINFLAQELKSLKEQQVLGGQPLEEIHLISHQFAIKLQSRLLTTVDTLSDLQQTHQRETRQLTDERDGVRAVNQVLKRKIATMEKQLRESKEVMESVLERVEVVHKGDWSTIEHGSIQVFSPIPPPSHCSEEAAGQDHSFHSEVLCTFHLQCQADNPSQSPDQLSPTFAHEGHQLARSTGSESQRKNQRSITLIAELTEELESLRREIKVELKLKHDEINRLKGLIDYRDEEIKQLMSRLEHFMGLDGFYVRHQYPEEDPAGMTEPSSTLNNPIGDLQMEEEIRQLEIQLKEVTQNSQFTAPMDDHSTRPTRVLDDLRRQSMAGNDRSSLISGNASDDQTISRVIHDLSNQVTDLRSTLKEVSRERDALDVCKRARKSTFFRSTPSETDPAESSCGPGTARSLASSLERSRLNRMLAQSESRIIELQRQIAEQESEFERVAERVQDKLKDQRSKVWNLELRLCRSSRIPYATSTSPNRAITDRVRRGQIAGTDDEKRVSRGAPAGPRALEISERRKKKNPSSHDHRLHPHRDSKAQDSSDAMSSSSASVASSIPSSHRLKRRDPFNERTCGSTALPPRVDPRTRRHRSRYIPNPHHLRCDITNIIKPQSSPSKDIVIIMSLATIQALEIVIAGTAARSPAVTRSLKSSLESSNGHLSYAALACLTPLARTLAAPAHQSTLKQLVLSLYSPASTVWPASSEMPSSEPGRQHAVPFSPPASAACEAHTDTTSQSSPRTEDVLQEIERIVKSKALQAKLLGLGYRSATIYWSKPSLETNPIYISINLNQIRPHKTLCYLSEIRSPVPRFDSIQNLSAFIGFNARGLRCYCSDCSIRCVTTQSFSTTSNPPVNSTSTMGSGADDTPPTLTDNGTPDQKVVLVTTL
ncbi:hypothetical protein H4Q26_013348 [Puccinia striiformis f. sp. tritici PST-130]|nr:hypothetical protein H4Q26_013348 [Puccinia striiformis f. sp. tritici PST-130]